MNVTGFMGKDGFVWWMGVVEDRNDPLFLGRLRVRILGWHTADKQILPTNTLPWAYPVLPLTSAGVSGIGMSPVGVVEGSWVIGFFRDGESGQDPVVFGTFGGIPQQKADTKKGFNDPNGVYPKPELVGKPDTNRLAVGDKSHPLIMSKRLSREFFVAKAGGGSWGQPDETYAAVYPHNQVAESTAGHVQEVDSTPNAERLLTAHKTGTYQEIDPKGNHIESIRGSGYHIVDGSHHVYVKGDCHVHVAGNCTLKVGGNLQTEIGGNWTVVAGGNINMRGSTIRLNDD